MDTAAAVPTEGPEQLVARVQDLQARLEAAPDPATRELAEELVSAVIQMYGEGLAKILDTLLASGSDGEQIAASLVGDPLVATLLLIHDLHPVPLADRVLGALESVRPYMESHGGNVELLSLQSGVARIRLQGSCSDCSASSVTLELAIKQALEEAAPDLDGLEVEGVAPQMGGLGLPMAGTGEPTGPGLSLVMSPAPAPPSWFEVRGVPSLRDGAIVAAEVAGTELLIANVEGTLLAYHDACAACGGALHHGEVRRGARA